MVVKVTDTISVDINVCWWSYNRT